MVEKIIEKVVTEMAPHLDQSQLEHLSNVLYVNFHGLEVQEQCTEVVPAGVEGQQEGSKPADQYPEAVYPGDL